jgi:beta-mannosidase
LRIGGNREARRSKRAGLKSGAILAALLLACGAHFARGVVSSSEDNTAKPPTGTRVYDVLPVAPRGENEISLDGRWDLAEEKRELDEKALDVSGLEWKQVQMPATIQYALYQAGAIENPWVGDSWKRLQWIQDHDWYLRRHFQIPSSWKDRHIRLRFDGMDYTGAVWLDGKMLGIHDGMFGGPTFDISPEVTAGSEHELIVRLIHETPTTPTQSMTPQLGIKPMKSWAIDGRSYVWGNRYRSIGLWRSVRLVSSGQTYMEAPWVRTDRLDRGSASLWAQTTILNVGPSFNGTVRARIVDGVSGKVVWTQDAQQRVPAGISYWERAIEVANPQLWWPVGMGDQHLYRLELSVIKDGVTEDSISSRFGIRTIEMRRNPYLPDKPRSNPGLPSWLTDQSKMADRHTDHLWQRKDLWQSDNLVEEETEYNSDAGARYLFVINNRPMYAKGVNWMTSDALLTQTPQREGWLVKAARLAGINLFRLNGGNDIFETEQFYNLCDEAGILVWQELPLTWTHDDGTPLTVWREQIKLSVLRIRQHPSLALYAGGNELNPYLEATAAHIGIGREIIAEYDDRPFRMASPMGTDYHAYASQEADFNDLWNGDPNWYVRDFSESANFISEWSYAVFPDLSTLRRVVPADELKGGPVGYDVDKFLATRPGIQEHIAEPGDTAMTEKKASWYGDLAKADLAQYIEYSQMAQADIYGYVFEQWRAQFPYKGGQAVWMYNPVSPSSGWNLIDWFGQPQMSYYSTKRADEPVAVMANTNYFSWGPGSIFHASAFALNDTTKPLLGCRMTARVLDRAMNPVLVRSWSLTIPAGGIKSASHQIQWQIPPEMKDGYFFLEMTLNDAQGHRISTRAYWLRVLTSLAKPEALAKWQAKASAETTSTDGPWLKPQIAENHTTVAAEVDTSKVTGSEMQVTVKVKNNGLKPAYPVKLSVGSDEYSSLWSDNYFWLAPGESKTIVGTIRLDMTGLDLVTHPVVAKATDVHLFVSAWNADTYDLNQPLAGSKKRAQ